MVGLPRITRRQLWRLAARLGIECCHNDWFARPRLVPTAAAAVAVSTRSRRGFLAASEISWGLPVAPSGIRAVARLFGVAAGRLGGKGVCL